MAIPGKEIYRGYDEYGPVQVIDDGDKRYLAFGDNDEQSCLLKSQPHVLQHEYTRAMMLVLLFSQPHSSLLLGLGGGGLAHSLHHCVPSVKQRVVELRQEVIDVAYRYFQLPQSQRLHVMQGDALEYLNTPGMAKTDVIFSDLYGAEGLELEQLQYEFIERCHDLLKDGGWLVLNCWHSHREEHDVIYVLKTLFADVRCCATVDGNWVVLAGKRTDNSSAKHLKAQAQKLSSQLGFSLSSRLNRLKSV